MRAIICLLMLTTVPSQADEWPSGPAPLILPVQTSGDELELQYTIRRMVTEVRTTTLTETVTYTEFEPSPSGPVLVERTDEVTTEVEYNVQVPLLETRVGRVSLDKVKAFDLSGKKLTVEQLKERTKTPVVVTISPYKRSVADLAFLSIMKPDTLHLVINAELPALGYEEKRDDTNAIPAPPLPEEVEPLAPPAN